LALAGEFRTLSAAAQLLMTKALLRRRSRLPASAKPWLAVAKTRLLLTWLQEYPCHQVMIHVNVAGCGRACTAAEQRFGSGILKIK